MGALSHRVTYQGYPATAFELRWDTGLEPSSGWVDLNLEDVQKILIDVKPIPWTGNVFPGLISIKAAQSARSTVASQPGGGVHQGPGFSNFGDLVLKTFNGTAPYKTPQTYKNLFIAESGVEEIERTLAKVRLHQEGKIRVQLTDIRIWYRKHGALLQRFNVRRPGGEFDQVTLKKTGGTAPSSSTNLDAGATGNGPGDSPFGTFDTTVAEVTQSNGGSESFAPWTAKEIMEHLLKLLPGSPIMGGNSDWAKDDLEPPVDIVGEGEPVVEWIAKLLKQYGYAAQLQPDCHTYLIMKIGKKVPYGQIATAENQFEEVDNVHYERKTVWINRRPPAVSVIGKRRVRRISLNYVPVFQSPDDGLFYKLDAVSEAFGYGLDQVNKQVMIGHEKNFRNVPPIGTAKAFHRAEALRKCAYRMYAPISAFPDGKNRATLQDLQRQAYMPMKKCPIYLDEMAAWIGMDDDVTDDKEGDKGPFALIGPIVRGYRYGQGFFKDYGAIQKHFDGLLQFVERELKWAETMKQWIEVRSSGSEPALIAPQQSLSTTYKDTNVIKYASKILKKFMKKEADEEMVSASALQQSMGKGVAADKMMQEELDRLKLVTNQEREVAKSAVSDAEAWKAAVNAEFGSYTSVFARGGGVQLKCQYPWGVITRGHYSINTATGIIMFHEPMVRLIQPFLMDNDSGQVRADGNITVTFGYELNTNTPLDWTTVSFAADETAPDEAPEPKLVSLCYPTAMPAHVEHASSMQMYEDQNGIPFNAAACVTEAASYATGILAVPHRVDGYTYELDGLRAAVLEGGITSVQHQMSDDGLAYTHVQVNAPYARSLIPGRIKESWVSSVEDRRRIETSKEQ